jgi:hypothetical protein
MLQVQNEVAAPEQLVVDPNGGFLAWLPHQDDTGLGFGQGSTQNIFNTYNKRGFLRPQLPVLDRNIRRRFNLRGYRGARDAWSCGWPYACHYDPEPFYQEKGVDGGNDDVWARHADRTTVEIREQKKTEEPKKVSKILVFILGLLVMIGAVYVF